MLPFDSLIYNCIMILGVLKKKNYGKKRLRDLLSVTRKEINEKGDKDYNPFYLFENVYAEGKDQSMVMENRRKMPWAQFLEKGTEHSAEIFLGSFLI